MKMFLEFFSEIFIFLRNIVSFLDFDLGRFGKVSDIPFVVIFALSKFGIFFTKMFYSGPIGQKEALGPILYKKDSYVLKYKNSKLCKKFTYYKTDPLGMMLFILAIIYLLTFSKII